MSLVPAKGVPQKDVVLDALKQIVQEAASPPPEPSGKKQFDELVRKGREDLKKQEAISVFLQKLGLIQKGLIEKQTGSKPEDYFLEGVRQVMEEPIGAALIQNLFDDFPLPQVVATERQKIRQQTRSVAQPGTKTPEEWITFQTLFVLGAFNLDRTKAVVKPDPKNLGPGYVAFKQENNRGMVVNILRPTISRILPK